jgi:integrase
MLDDAFHDALARARAAVSDGAPDLNAILREYLRETLEHDLSPITRPMASCPRVLWPAGLLEESLDEAKRYLASRDIYMLEHRVARLMRQHELPQGMRSAIEVGVLEAEVRIYEEALKRARGEVPLVLLPEVPGAAPSTAPMAAPEPAAAIVPGIPTVCAPRASALVEPFFGRRESLDRATHQVMGQERGTLRRFIEVCGDRPIDDYRRGDITGFLDTLRRLPAAYGKSPKDKDRTLADIIEGADRADAERLTEKTVKRHLSALSQFFQFAVDQSHLTTTARAELVDDHRFRVDGPGARSQRDAWTPEELTKLFASPVWTGCLGAHRRSTPGGHVIRDARFWLPLLALFHGARLEEFADLYRRDLGWEDGTWFVRITEAEGRRLKTDNAERVVPLHPELVRLGFPEYAAGIAPNPNDPLFPDLEPQGKDRKRGPRMTRWFVEYRREVGVYREGVGMHAFRHTANTRLRDAIQGFQQERHVAYLLGHSQGGGEGRERYDKGPGLKAVAETLALLAFPEVNLSHLHLEPAVTGDAQRPAARSSAAAGRWPSG